MPSRRETAVFLVRRRGTQVLLAHRAPALGSFWHPISGRVENGESFEEAALRELLEETGLTAELTGSDACDFVYGNDVHVRCFLLRVDDDFEPTLDWEHDGHRWCSPDEAHELLHWDTLSDALHSFTAMPLAA